eukprot:7380442-Prymnesium_polylepis.2
MCVSGCSGGGLPPLSTSLSDASAHCDTPKDAMMPSSVFWIDSGCSANEMVTALVPPASTVPLG